MNEDGTTFAAHIRGLIDYEVLDKDNHKFGKVESIWEDPSGKPTFLSIRTGWLGMGRSYFVPAHSVEVSEKSRLVRLPYDEATIKTGPEFASESDIDQAAVLRIYEYYRPFGTAIPQGSGYDWYPAAEIGQPNLTAQDSAKERPGEGSLSLKEEQVQVAGEVRTTERTEKNTQHISETVRKEDVEAERESGSEPRSK